MSKTGKVTNLNVVKKNSKNYSKVSALSPREIVSELDRYVIGQKEAKKAVAVALRNRWRRQALSDEMRDEVLPKNILMIGPTGVGKTEISRRLSKLAQAPFIKVEATRFTEVGYVGRDVEQIIRDLIEIAIAMEKERKRKEVKAINRSLVRHAANEVFGDARQPDSRGRVRVWGAGVVVLSLAIALVAVNLEQFSVVLKEEKVSTTAQVEAQEAVVPESAEPIVTREPAQPNWELGEAAGLSKLWLAASDLPVPASICPPPPITSIRCTVTNAQVWNDLASLNRPVLLATVTADKFQGAILVVQFEGADAVVWSDQGLILVPLSDLATAWTGGYTF